SGGAPDTAQGARNHRAPRGAGRGERGADVRAGLERADRAARARDPAREAGQGETEAEEAGGSAAVARASPPHVRLAPRALFVAAMVATVALILATTPTLTPCSSARSRRGSRGC